MDARSGEVTGVSPGVGAVQVRHGGLSATDTVRVRQNGDCTGMSVFLRNKAPRVGETLEYFASYEPRGCVPPPGLARLSTSQLDLFERDVRDNLVARRTGNATIFGTHGALLRDPVEHQVVIASAPNCTSIALTLSPPQARPGESVRLDVTGTAPQPCRIPEGRTAYGESVTGYGKGFYLGDFTPGFTGLRVTSGTPGGTVTVRQGGLTASAPLRIIDDPSLRPLCQPVSVNVSNTEIPIGGIALVTVVMPTGTNCQPSRLEVRRVIEPFREEFEPIRIIPDPRNPDRIQIEGLAGGLGQTYTRLVDRANPNGLYTINSPRLPVIRVTAPACVSAQLSFDRTNLRPGDVTTAKVRYTPQGCMPPEGPIVLESDNPEAAAPPRQFPASDVRSEWYGNWIIARPKLRDVYTVTITLRHGALTSRAPLFIGD